MLKLCGLTVLALLLASNSAAPRSACLPTSVFKKNAVEELPTFDLGYVNSLLTLCAFEREPDFKVDKILGCWTVDPATAALRTSSARAIPGRGRRTDLDTQNCIDGYCIAPISPEDRRPFFTISTDGAHAAILTDKLLYIFQTSTKAKVTEIRLTKQDAPPETNVTNMAWGLLYSGDTLFVVGTDAGPFVGVWVFKENGERGGAVSSHVDPFNIFGGGYGILGSNEVALADAGLQVMIVVSGSNATKRIIKRSVSYSPCTTDQFNQWVNGNDNQPGACKRVLDTSYGPYADMSPVQLPSGDIITTLSGPAQGYIAVLDPANLREIRRLPLARCR
jgi:hypothetical protein